MESKCFQIVSVKKKDKSLFHTVLDLCHCVRKQPSDRCGHVVTLTLLLLSEISLRRSRGLGIGGNMEYLYLDI